MYPDIEAKYKGMKWLSAAAATIAFVYNK